MQGKEIIRTFIIEAASRLHHDITLKDDDDIFKMRLVSSIFAMKLIRFIEKEFDIRCTEKDLSIKNFNTINNILHFIENKKVTT